jgi:hypothetical protein
MARHLRSLAAAAVLAVATLVAFASPAAAQQPIDATEQGGEAFIAFTVMVVLMVGALFFMDRVRRRRSGD